MIYLEKITAANWKKAVLVTTDPQRKRPLEEEWMMNSAFSMLQSVYEPEWESRLILDDEKAIGFVFYGFWKKKGVYLLCRYAIDIAEQGKGYGTKALPVVLDAMRRQYGCRDIYLTLENENKRAIRLYKKAGFVPTGETDEGEEIYVLSVKDEKLKGDGD